MRSRLITFLTLQWLVVSMVVPPSGDQSSKGWVAARTADGVPDLEGVWDFRTATPLERPAEFAGREFLTDQDVAAVEQRAAERLRVQRSDDLLLNTAPWWLDFGTHVVGARRSSLIIDPPDGRIPSMTPAAARRQANALTARAAVDGPEGLTSWDRCITRGLPEVMLPTAYNNNLQIIQTPGYVVIVTEMIHEARIVPTDGRAHLPQAVRAWNGDSRGHWEGDSLVVETTNFSDTANFRGAGENLRLTERFTRRDATTIDYRFTVEDPTTWSAPWSVAFTLLKSEELIYEYACHEANYSLENMLRIARAAERDAEAARRR
jgi:hypothetical protein